MRHELSDVQWKVIEPLLPPPKRMGRPRADDRKTLGGILWVLRARPEYLIADRGYDSRGFRRVLVRHERLLTTYRAFVVLACVMVTLGALPK